MDQKRADTYVSLLLGTHAGCGHGGLAAINITVSAEALIGRSEEPGFLAGYGELPAGICRQLAVDGRWRRLLVDQPTGQISEVAARTYAPGAGVRRTVLARHRTCVFPGCQHAAATCDLDHVVAFSAGGSTVVGNLAPLCRRHHRLKHSGRWKVGHDGKGGFVWSNAGLGLRLHHEVEPGVAV